MSLTIEVSEIYVHSLIFSYSACFLCGSEKRLFADIFILALFIVWEGRALS